MPVHFAEEDELIEEVPLPPSDEEGEESSLDSSSGSHTLPEPLHPFLSLGVAEDLEWDLRTKPPPWVDDLEDPLATQPPVKRLMLASSSFKKKTPVTITEAQGDKSVTVNTVINAIHRELHRRLGAKEFNDSEKFPVEKQKAVSNAYNIRVTTFPDQAKEAKRVDLLGEDILFGGLVKVDQTWELVTTSP